MSRFADGVMATLLHQVCEQDRSRIFRERASLLINLAGPDRLEVRSNGTLLSIKVFEREEAGRILR